MIETNGVACDELLSALTWSAHTSPISLLKKDDLSVLDEKVALEAAGGDLECLV